MYYGVTTINIRCIQPHDASPLTPIGDKSYKIECCVNKMLQMIQNMIFSRGLELGLSIFRKTTNSLLYQVSID